MKKGGALASSLKSAAANQVDERLRRRFPGLAADLMQFGQYWPHEHQADSRHPSGSWSWAARAAA